MPMSDFPANSSDGGSPDDVVRPMAAGAPPGSASEQLHDAALQAWRAGRFDEAERQLNDAAAAAEGELLSDRPLAAVLFDLGRLYCDWKRFDRAAEMYRKALGLREQELGPGHASVAESLFHLAWAVWQAGRPKEADRLLRRARPVAEAALG